MTRGLAGAGFSTKPNRVVLNAFAKVEAIMMENTDKKATASIVRNAKAAVRFFFMGDA
jgi:hypothetical protein